MQNVHHTNRQCTFRAHIQDSSQYRTALHKATTRPQELRRCKPPHGWLTCGNKGKRIAMKRLIFIVNSNPLSYFNLHINEISSRLPPEEKRWKKKIFLGKEKEFFSFLFLKKTIREEMPKNWKDLFSANRHQMTVLKMQNWSLQHSYPEKVQRFSNNYRSSSPLLKSRLSSHLFVVSVTVKPIKLSQYNSYVLLTLPLGEWSDDVSWTKRIRFTLLHLWT